MKEKIQKIYNIGLTKILSHVIMIILNVFVIGISQVILDYGSMKIYLLTFGLGLVFRPATKLLEKILGD